MLLVVMHTSPFAGTLGGTERHVRDIASDLRLDALHIAYPEGDGYTLATLTRGGLDAPELRHFPCANVPRGAVFARHPPVDAMLREWVSTFAIDAVHLHHLLGFPADLGRSLHQLGVPYVYTCHDYYAVCPMWDLFDRKRGTSCECTARTQGRCLRAGLGPELGPFDPRALVAEHRRAMDETLAHARAIIFPSSSALAIAAARLPQISERACVIEHGLSLTRPPRTSRAPRTGPLKVAVLGAAHLQHKGRDTYTRLVRKSRRLPIHWHFFGVREERFDRALRECRNEAVSLHGPYERDSIVGKLIEHDIDLYVGASASPETFSYTFHEALLAGVPALVTPLGAPAARVAKEGVGWVAPPKKLVSVLERLSKRPSELERAAERAAAVPLRSVRESTAELVALYARCSLPITPPRAS